MQSRSQKQRRKVQTAWGRNIKDISIRLPHLTIGARSISSRIPAELKQAKYGAAGFTIFSITLRTPPVSRPDTKYETIPSERTQPGKVGKQLRL